MISIEAYFDESGSHDGSAAYSVAGFAFERDHAQQMRSEWKEVLDGHGLSVFHMADFAPGNGPYKHLSRAERIAIQRRLQDVLYRHAAFGFAVSARDSDRQDLYAYNADMPNAFSMCCSVCLATMNDWLQSKGYSNKNAAFFFEAGNKNQAEADVLLKKLCAARKDISVSFVSKTTGGGPLQAADMLAWLQNKFVKSQMDGTKHIRADLLAIAENIDCVGFVLKGFKKRQFIELATGYVNYFPGPSSKALTGNFGRMKF